MTYVDVGNAGNAGAIPSPPSTPYMPKQILKTFQPLYESNQTGLTGFFRINKGLLQIHCVCPGTILRVSSRPEQIHYAVLLILTNLVNPVFSWAQSVGFVGMVDAASALSTLRFTALSAAPPGFQTGSEACTAIHPSARHSGRYRAPGQDTANAPHRSCFP